MGSCSEMATLFNTCTDSQRLGPEATHTKANTHTKKINTSKTTQGNKHNKKTMKATPRKTTSSKRPTRICNLLLILGDVLVHSCSFSSILINSWTLPALPFRCPNPGKSSYLPTSKSLWSASKKSKPLQAPSPSSPHGQEGL